MSNLREKIIKAGLDTRVFTDRQLAGIIGGTSARRYGLVNRALKDGTLLRLKRGLYTLAGPHTGSSIHPFVIAQAFKSGSYISFETALAHHGWIPEAVFTTTSVTPARKTLEYEHDVFGRFQFFPLALNDYQFFVGVKRITLNQRPALLAAPLRALMDLVARRKLVWQGREWIEQSLRIDNAHLDTLRREDFQRLSGTYKHKRTQDFLEQFQLSLFDHTVLTEQQIHKGRKGLNKHD